jgi:hypothetical protein
MRVGILFPLTVLEALGAGTLPVMAAECAPGSKRHVV